MRWLLVSATVLVLATVTVASVVAQTPVETARGLLHQYQDDPTRIDRACDLLEAAVAKGGGNDVPTLLTLPRARILFGGERTRTDEAKVGAYARASRRSAAAEDCEVCGVSPISR